jgi:hypothetical protein
MKTAARDRPFLISGIGSEAQSCAVGLKLGWLRCT